MDHAGAAAGTLLGAGVLWAVGGAAGAATTAQLRTVFLWAAVPGVLAVVALALTREPPRAGPAPGPARAPAPIPPALRRALLPIVLFAFANATDAFILVKLARLGAAPVLAPVLWLALHVVKAATATAGGRLADRHGRRNTLAAGWTVYAVLWSAVGFAESVPVLFALSAAYGVSHGLVEGAERALVADLGGHGKGKAFGAYNMLVGLAALAASTGFGVVWDRLGSAAAFAGSGAFALLAVAALLALVPARTAAAR
jgi:MFS family permease